MAEDKAKDAKPEAAEKPTPEEKTAPAKKKKDDKKKEAAGAEKKTKKVDYGPDFKYIVRIANTDLDGTKTVQLALTGIKGVGNRVANIIADHAGVPRNEKIGKLSDAQVDGLAKTVEGVAAILPPWAVNHPLDWESGQDLHLIGSNVDILLRDDINRLKKIRSYRGVRHELGQKVRGQRSRSNGRTGLTVGVSRVKAPEGEKKEEPKAAAPAAAAPKAAAPAAAKPAAPAKPAEGGKK
jgi:small subunit ribosomal protein S13